MSPGSSLPGSPARARRVAFFSHLDTNLYLFRLPWMLALQEAGFDVHAITPPGRHLALIAEQGIATVPFEMRRGSLNPIRLASNVARLAAVLREHGYGMLDAFTLQGCVIAAPAARLAGVSSVFCHVTGLGYVFTEQSARVRLLRHAVRALSRAAFLAADRVIVQNEDDGAEIASLVPPGRMALVPGTGVDTRDFAPGAVGPAAIERLRGEIGLEPDNVVVTLVGRMLRNKGVTELVEATRNVALRRPEVRLVLVGWRDEGNPAVLGADDLDRIRREPFVRYLGERDDVREILAATDVYALPSYREGTPRTVLEAMAMGKPVITTDVPGCRQTVDHGVTGFLVPRADSRSIERHLDNLVADADLRTRMGAAGRAKVERQFSCDVIVEQIVRLHRELTPPPS